MTSGVGERSVVYTDRSVYRPLQEIFWKVVAYGGRSEEGRFETLTSRQFTVELTDANGEVVDSAQVTSNDFGSASGAFQIPSGRLLGRWHLRTSLGGGASVRVEEYKRPTFEVTIAEPEEPLRLNRPATLSGEARYYFGLPVVDGEVAWRVSRVPVYPLWYWWRKPVAETRVVASGEAKLGADGTFEMAFLPAADEREAESGASYRYELQVEVTDEGGETRSAERTFRLGFVAVETRLDPAAGFFQPRQAVRITAHRSDLGRHAPSGRCGVAAASIGAAGRSASTRRSSGCGGAGPRRATQSLSDRRRSTAGHGGAVTIESNRFCDLGCRVTRSVREIWRTAPTARRRSILRASSREPTDWTTRPQARLGSSSRTVGISW